MSGKLTGLIACAALIVTAILVSWFSVENTFRHQHTGEYTVLDPVFIPEPDSAGERIRLGEDDYHLNEYLFRNLAGELLPRAPETVYYQDPEDGSIVQFQQDPVECVRSACEYAVRIRHGDTSRSEPDSAEPIVTFADYNYFDPSERTGTVVIDGLRESSSIRLDISRFEKSLYSYVYDSRLYGYRSRINVLCFVDCFLLYELAYPGNRAENDTVLYCSSNGNFEVCTAGFPGSGSYQGKADYHNLVSSVWFSMLLKSRDFTENIIREYRYQRSHLFSEEYLFDYLESASAFLAQSERIDQSELNRQKNRLCDYLQQRLDWLDDNIESLREFSALSAVKEFRNTPY